MNKLEELERKIESLQAEVLDLKSVIRRLVISKVTNPKYAYWNWLIEREATEEQRVMIETVIRIYGMRYRDEPIPDFFKRDKLASMIDQLYTPSKPNYLEVAEGMRSIIGTRTTDFVPELLEALRDQGIERELCEHLLAARHAE